MSILNTLVQALRIKQQTKQTSITARQRTDIPVEKFIKPTRKTCSVSEEVKSLERKSKKGGRSAKAEGGGIAIIIGPVPESLTGEQRLARETNIQTCFLFFNFISLFYFNLFSFYFTLILFFEQCLICSTTLTAPKGWTLLLFTALFRGLKQ